MRYCLTALLVFDSYYDVCKLVKREKEFINSRLAWWVCGHVKCSRSLARQEITHE